MSCVPEAAEMAEVGGMVAQEGTELGSVLLFEVLKYEKKERGGDLPLTPWTLCMLLSRQSGGESLRVIMYLDKVEGLEPRER
ncbi:hypothetical protein AOLI_G00208950 [Acnodon oligacanthus]